MKFKISFYKKHQPLGENMGIGEMDLDLFKTLDIALNGEILFPSKLNQGQRITFNVVSEMKGGWNLWKKDPSNPEGPRTTMVYRYNDKSSAIRERNSSENPAEIKPPQFFLIFVAYLHEEDILKGIVVNARSLLDQISQLEKAYNNEAFKNTVAMLERKPDKGNYPVYEISVDKKFSHITNGRVPREYELSEKAKKQLATTKFNLENYFEYKPIFEDAS